MVAVLALATVMVFAMFSTQDATATSRSQSGEQSRGGKLDRFQENLGKSFHRAFGDVL